MESCMFIYVYYWHIFNTTTKNAARMPQINECNRLPWSALRCHRDRLSTIILAPFLAVVLIIIRIMVVKVWNTRKTFDQSLCLDFPIL